MLIYIIQALTLTFIGSLVVALDTSYYYRLTNEYTGSGKSLDVIPDDSGLLKMAETGDYSGQYWKFVPHGVKFNLRTKYRGDAYSLDVINDDNINSKTPYLASTDDRSGQSWTLTPWEDGTYQLTNDFTGLDKHLDVYNDTLKPALNSGIASGQHWTLTKTSKI